MATRPASRRPRPPDGAAAGDDALARHLAAVPVRDPGSTLAEGWHHGAFMQVFVRSYRDGNGDGIGDLRGLIDSLDYLQDLGLRGLWLMPIHPSEDGDHGYAVTDYRAIHPDYGTLDDFDELVRQAHARSLGIVIDYVPNHSASAHPLFQQSRRGPANRFRDWYVWRYGHPAGWSIYGHDPWRDDGEGAYFAAFSRRMPDFDWGNPEVVRWHHDNLRFWLNRGVDGFRFDAVGHLVENGPQAWDCQPENYPLMAGIRRVLDAYQRRFMVCEVPGDPQGFARVAGSAFAFDLNGALVAAARGEPQALQKVARYFDTAPPTMSTLLSNHDAFAGRRVHDQLGGDERRLRLAAAMLLLSPGSPFVYYGEEIGMAGHDALGADPALRTPMSWSADGAAAGFSAVKPYRAPSPNRATHNVERQRGEPGSLHAFYRSMLRLRNTRPSLARGAIEHSVTDGAVWHFQRTLAGERTLVVVDTGARQAHETVTGLPPGARLRSLYPLHAGDLSADARGVAQVEVAAQAVRVFDVS